MKNPFYSEENAHKPDANTLKIQKDRFVKGSSITAQGLSRVPFLNDKFHVGDMVNMLCSDSNEYIGTVVNVNAHLITIQCTDGTKKTSAVSMTRKIVSK